MTFGCNCGTVSPLPDLELGTVDAIYHVCPNCKTQIKLQTSIHNVVAERKETSHEPIKTN